MNKRGLVFSLSMLFLILSFVLLQQSILKTSLVQQDTASAINFFQKLSGYYSNFSENIIVLDSESSFQQIQERTIPFTYNVDGNALSLGFKVPVKEAVLGRFFDLINSFKIFVEDNNYSNFFSGIDANVFTVQNPSWGGTANSLNFVVEPSCMNFSAQESGVVFSRAWCGSFDLNDAMRIDANISVNFANEDLNLVSCQWEGSAACPSQNFDSLNPNPYFNLKISDENCALCSFNLTEVKGHFDTTQDNWIAIQCIGSSCSSKQIDLNIAEGFSISRDKNAAQVSVSTSILLKKRITKFYFNDLNLSLSIKDFNLSMETPK